MTQTTPRNLLSHRHTIYASYVAYIVQAVGNNFAPLLFLTFASTYHLSLDRITLLVTINFMVQLGVDLICAKAIDKMGYRLAMVFAHLFAAFCRSQNIPCYVVDGMSRTNRADLHTWNRVYYNNSWWNVDVTFDIIQSKNQGKLYGFHEIDGPYVTIKEFFITKTY